MALTCVTLSAPAIWATVQSYTQGMADCGTGFSLFTTSELATYTNAAIAGSGAAASGVVAVTSAPFDAVLAASYWSFALTFSLGCYLIAKNAGMILSAIKRL